MKEKWLIQIGAAVMGILVWAFAALIMGVIVMLLWNWLMPNLFSLTTINYIEGWGISFLSGMLFKGTVTVKSKE